MRRIALALLLACVLSTATAATAHAVSAPTITRPQGGAGPFVKWLLRQASKVFGQQARRVAVDQAQEWTRRQAIDWYCTGWLRYYGYSYTRWRQAAFGYYEPRWAWNYCTQNWA
jgi:hypothetical protein